ANAGAMTNAAPNDNEVCPKCKNKKHGGDCWKCGKYGKLRHKTAAYLSLDIKDARRYIENGCEIFLAQVTKQESKLKRLEDVHVIQDFPEVFPEELPGLSPHRQVELRIDLIPGVAPVARAPNRLASSEMKELSEKGFIRSSSSPWGAPVLFVKKKDGSF
nr:putative reverse transcriptase domain-containing protein [Tanacetum cinerariifolium]